MIPRECQHNPTNGSRTAAVMLIGLPKCKVFAPKHGVVFGIDTRLPMAWKRIGRHSLASSLVNILSSAPNRFDAALS